MEDLPIVTITGIAGFVGSQVCLQFLQTGQYKVRGTVRDAKKPSKIDPLKKAFGELFNQLELVEADLLDEASLVKAVEGSTYLVHTASPFSMNLKGDELIKPAVEGTLSACRAAHKAGVKRVVITSSCVSIMVGHDLKKKSHFTAADWTINEKADDYSKSKTMAEQAAWDFQKSLPEAERFEIATVNPGLIFGPTLVTSWF